MANYPRSTAKLSQFRGTFIILDFWATWCISCINKFSKLDLLQKKFKGKLQFLLVNCSNTKDDERKIKAFYRTWEKKYQKPLSLPSVIADVQLQKMFPHKLIPHYVWISEQGIVLAITSAEEITSENIMSFLRGEIIDLPFKMDIDLEKPLFSGEYFPENKMQAYSVFLKGKINGLSSGTRIYKIENTIRGRLITNMSILSMYQIVAGKLIPGSNEKRWVLDLKDSSNFYKEKFELGENEWNTVNIYSYEIIVPVKDTNRLYEYMLEDLNRYSNYSGKIEKRKIKCYALIRTNYTDKIQSNGAKAEDRLYDNGKKYLVNLPVTYLIRRLNNADSIKFPVIDETNYTANVDISINADFDDFSALRKELKRYSLDLIETEKILDVFVLREKVGEK
jgi:thiol-disulfide isomerase/thioredoxin